MGVLCTQETLNELDLISKIEASGLSAVFSVEFFEKVEINTEDLWQVFDPKEHFDFSKHFFFSIDNVVFASKKAVTIDDVKRIVDGFSEINNVEYTVTFKNSRQFVSFISQHDKLMAIKNVIILSKTDKEKS